MESSLDSSFADVDLLSIPSPVVIQQESQSQEENTAGEPAAEEITDDMNEQQGIILDNQVPSVSISSPDLKQVMSPRAPGDQLDQLEGKQHHKLPRSKQEPPTLQDG